MMSRCSSATMISKRSLRWPDRMLLRMVRRAVMMLMFVCASVSCWQLITQNEGKLVGDPSTASAADGSADDCSDDDRHHCCEAVRLMDEMTRHMGGHVRDQFLAAYGGHPAFLGQAGPRIISLVDALPEPPQCRTVSLSHTVQELQNPWSSTVISRDTAVLGPLHEFSLTALAMTPSHAAPEEVVAYHLYTDGSAGSEDAGWGVVVLAEVIGASFVFVGFFGGPLCLLGEEGHVGAEASDNIAAEYSAIVWALLWSHQLRGNVPIHIHFDCTAAGMAASGWAKVSAQRQLAFVMRTLSVMLERCRPVHYSHVKDHSGHPWNELADRVANAGRKRSILAPVRLPIADWLSNGLFVGEWVFLESLPEDEKVAYPPVVNGLITALPARFPTDPTMRLRHRIASGHDFDAATATPRGGGNKRLRRKRETPNLNIKMGSANVLTLLPGKCRRGDGNSGLCGRAHAIMRQCHDHGLKLLECMRPEPLGRVHAPLNTIMSSAAVPTIKASLDVSFGSPQRCLFPTTKIGHAISSRHALSWSMRHRDTSSPPCV